MIRPTSAGGAGRLRNVLAFAAIYLVWGSTYLFIRFAIAEIPPLLMAGGRMLIAGALMLAFLRLRGVPPPRGREWAWGLAIGGLFFLVGNGAVVWTEQSVPSGVVALTVATVPMWVVLLPWVSRRGPSPRPLALAGLAIGFLGMTVLVGDRLGRGPAAWDPFTVAVLVLGPVGWASGTLLARRAPQPASPFAAGAMQMICGGVLLLVAGGLAGEVPRLSGHALTPLAAWSLVYLIMAGSIVAFSAYVWLLRHQPPAAVATYAYVNPLVAMLLGWMFAGEALGGRVLAAAVLIVSAVAMITRSAGAPPPATRGEFR